MRTIVELKDGRTIDISDLSAADAVATLKRAGVTTDQIKHTTHYIPRA